MVKMPSSLGELQAPRASRGIATINAGPALEAQANTSRYTKAGFDALSGGLGDMEAALYKRQLQDEEREVKTLDVEFAKQRRLINQKFRSTQGENTIKARATLDKEFATAKEQLLKGASSSRVKQAFSLLAEAKTQGELEQADTYTEAQRLDANNEASKAVLTEAFQSSAENWGSPTAMALNEKTITQEVMSQGRINGWSADVVKSKTQAAISQMVKMQVLAAAETDPDKALAIYEDAKNKVDGDVRIELEKQLIAVTIDAMAQAGAEEAIGLYPGSITKQRAYIREKWSGQKEQAMIQELDKRLMEGRSEMSWQMQLESYASSKLERQMRLDARIEKENIDAAGDSLYEALRKGQTREEWELANPDAAKWLIRDNYRSETLDRVATRLEIGREFNDVSETSTITKYSNMNVEDLAKVTDSQLEMEKANLSMTDWKKLATRVGAAKNSMSAADSATSGLYKTADTIIAAQVPRNKKGKPTLNDKQFNTLQIEMYVFIDEHAASGTIVKHADLVKEAQRLMIGITADPKNTSWWGAPGMALPMEGEEAFQGIVAEYKTLSPQQKAVVTVPKDDIPVDLLDGIKAAIANRGIQATDDLIEQLAGAYAVGDTARAMKLLGGK